MLKIKRVAIFCGVLISISLLFFVAGPRAVSLHYFVWLAAQAGIFTAAILYLLNSISRWHLILISCGATVLCAIFHLIWWLFISIPQELVESLGLPNEVGEAVIYMVNSSIAAFLFYIYLQASINGQIGVQRCLYITVLCSLAGLLFTLGGNWGLSLGNASWLFLFSIGFFWPWIRSPKRYVET